MHRPETCLETARALAANDDPVLRVEALELVRSPRDLGDRQIADTDPVGEPGRIRHFVESVHVDGADRRAVGRRRERLQQEVVTFGQLPFLDAARIHGSVVIPQDWVVWKELQRGPCSLGHRTWADAYGDRSNAGDGRGKPQHFKTHRRTSEVRACLRARRKPRRVEKPRPRGCPPGSRIRNHVRACRSRRARDRPRRCRRKARRSRIR